MNAALCESSSVQCVDDAVLAIKSWARHQSVTHGFNETMTFTTNVNDAKVVFEGTSVKVYGWWAGDEGTNATFTVDGGETFAFSKTTPSFTSGIPQKSAPVSQLLFSQSGLAPGKHSLSMVNSGSQLAIDGLLLENRPASTSQKVSSTSSRATASATPTFVSAPFSIPNSPGVSTPTAASSTSTSSLPSITTSNTTSSAKGINTASISSGSPESTTITTSLPSRPPSVSGLLPTQPPSTTSRSSVLGSGASSQASPPESTANSMGTAPAHSLSTPLKLAIIIGASVVGGTIVLLFLRLVFRGRRRSPPLRPFVALESEPSSPAQKGNSGPVTLARSPDNVLYIGPSARLSEFTSERRAVASFRPAPSTTPSMWGTGSSDRAFDGSHATGCPAIRAVAEEQAAGIERPVAAANTRGGRRTGSARCAPLEDSSSGSTLPPPYE